MSAIIGQLFQDIGQVALDEAEELAGKLLVYAEVEDGVISPSLFFVNKNGVLRFKFCSESMKYLIYSLWERWQEQEPPNNCEWRVMCYVIEGGKFEVAFTYPDQLNEDEDDFDRSEQAIKYYFNDLKVDYSRPD